MAAKTIGYIRVSTDQQTTENQKLAILEYANANNMTVDEWVEIEVSSRKSTKQRKVDELLSKVKTGDTIIVSELSRLGRSVGQIATLVDALIKENVFLRALKDNIHINGKMDNGTLAQVTLFSLMAELERNFISERTKEGLNRARAEGKLLGRPKGHGKSVLDGKESEIKGYLEKELPVASIAKLCNVKYGTMRHFINSRGLK